MSSFKSLPIETLCESFWPLGMLNIVILTPCGITAGNCFIGRPRPFCNFAHLIEPLLYVVHLVPLLLRHLRDCWWDSQPCMSQVMPEDSPLDCPCKHASQDIGTLEMCLLGLVLFPNITVRELNDTNA